MKAAVFILAGVGLLVAAPAISQNVIEHSRVQGALADLAVIQAQRLSELAGYAPTIEGHASGGYSYSRDVNNKIADPSIVDTLPKGPWTADVTITQPLIKPDATLQEALDIIDANIAVAQSKVEDACATVARDADLIRVAAGADSARLAVSRETQLRLLQTTREVESRVKAAEVPASDLLEARDRQQRWIAAQLQAEASSEAAAARWSKLWSTQQVQVLKAAQTQEVACASQDQCQELVKAGFPLLKAAQQRVQAAQLQLNKAAHLRLPQLDAQVVARHNVQTYQTQESDELTAKLVGRVQLPWGVQAATKRQEQVAALQAAQQHLRLTKDEATGDARVAYLTERADRVQLKAAAIRRLNADATLKAMREGYKAAKKDARSVLDAVEATATIDVEMVRLREEMGTASVMLAYLTGAYGCGK